MCSRERKTWVRFSRAVEEASLATRKSGVMLVSHVGRRVSWDLVLNSYYGPSWKGTALVTEVCSLTGLEIFFISWYPRPYELNAMMRVWIFVDYAV